MNWIDLAAIAAAAMQVLGYALYLRHAIRGETRPNAASSLMFAYGTGLLVYLEYEAGGSWRILLLPAVCGVLGLFVAALSVRSGSNASASRLELGAFLLDLVLTALYLLLFVASQADANPARRQELAFWFLVASNATTLTSFAPLLLTTHAEPEREQATPWFVWSAAYAVLLVVAVADGGREAPVLLVYPALNLFLHASIGLLSTRSPRVLAAKLVL